MTISESPSTVASLSTLIGGARPIPRVIVGTGRLGLFLPDAVTPGRDKLFRYLDAVLALGCCAFDSAASYQLGGTERALGAWMRDRRNRDQVFLIIKGANSYPLVRPHPLAPAIIRSDLEGSLRRLGTSRVELFMLHRDDPAAPLEPVVETLEALYRAGDFLAWGVSNWQPERVAALAPLAAAAKLPPLAASSPQFSLAAWTKPPYAGSASISGDANSAARTFYRSRQIPVLAWSPLAHGFLASANASGPSTYQTPANLARRQRIAMLAGKRGLSMAQVALAYLFSQPFPVFAIVAASRTDSVRRNLEASAIRLTETELRWLEAGDAGAS